MFHDQSQLGGTRKTFLLNSIISFLKLQERKVIAVALCCVAATLLHNSATPYSSFKIPLDITDTLTYNVPVESKLVEKLLEACVIIWDEINMMPNQHLKALYRLFKDIIQNIFPFGGKTVVLPGHFRQILRVIPPGSNSQIIRTCFKFSKL